MLDTLINAFSSIALILSGIIGIITAYFFSDYIVFFLKFISSHLKTFFIITALFAFLGIAGTLLSFTLFHLYSAIILVGAPFITQFTANIIGGGFIGLFLLTIGFISMKMFSK